MNEQKPISIAVVGADLSSAAVPVKMPAGWDPSKEKQPLSIPGLTDARIEEVLQALIRLYTGKTRKVTIYRRGPVQETI